MKFRIAIKVIDTTGVYKLPGRTFLRRRTTRASAEGFVVSVLRWGFRRRIGKVTIFYPPHRIWQVKVEEL